MTPSPQVQQALDLANLIQQRKPYIPELEQRIHDLEFGTLEVVVHVRAGVVEKMEFVSKKTWLRDKKLDNLPQNMVQTK